MKKISILLLTVLGIALSMQSCDNNKTYAEQLKEERHIIKQFIREQQIEKIDMAQFKAQDSVTYDNQYVEFSGEGVYMHVVHEASGENARYAKTNDLVLVRFVQIDLLNRDTISSFENVGYNPDEFRYTRTSSSILGQFVGDGLMQTVYGQSVPAGWLMPLSYLKLSSNSGSDRTKIKLIVSAKNGNAEALKKVYPCYYELTYQFPK